MTDIEAIDLDDAVLDALGVPESATRMYRERVDPSLVLDSATREVYEWVYGYFVDSFEAPTPEMILTEFPGLTFEEPKCSVDWLIEKLRQRHLRNELKPVLREASKSLADDPRGAMQILSASQSTLTAQTRTRDIEIDASDWDDAMSRYLARKEAGQLHGLSMGFHELDDVLGGYRIGTLSMTIARPKRFKSFVLLKSAIVNQMNGAKAVFFTPELSKEEMFDRYLCMCAGIPYTLFMRGQLMTEHYDMLADARDLVHSLDKPLSIIRPPAGQRSVAQMVDLAGEMGAEILYIDGIKYMESSKPFKADQKWLEVASVAEELKEASEHFPIVAAAQFNREAASMTEMADLSKIGLSDAIGQVADLIMGIYANKDMLGQRVVEYGVVDSRSTEQASWLLDVKVASHSDIQVRERVMR